MGYYGQPAPPAKKSKKKGLVIGGLILVAGVCLLLCAGIIGALGTSDNGNAPTTAVTDAGERTADAVKGIHPTTPNPTTSKPKQVTISGDDIVHVGEDVPPGTYRAAEPVTDGISCYWAKTRDAEGDNIISNDIPQGGRPQVTLKSGQWFTSQGCPTWVKR